MTDEQATDQGDGIGANTKAGEREDQFRDQVAGLLWGLYCMMKSMGIQREHMPAEYQSLIDKLYGEDDLIHDRDDVLHRLKRHLDAGKKCSVTIEDHEDDDAKASVGTRFFNEWGQGPVSVVYMMYEVMQGALTTAIQIGKAAGMPDDIIYAILQGDLDAANEYAQQIQQEQSDDGVEQAPGSGGSAVEGD